MLLPTFILLLWFEIYDLVISCCFILSFIKLKFWGPIGFWVGKLSFFYLVSLFLVPHWMGQRRQSGLNTNSSKDYCYELLDTGRVRHTLAHVLHAVSAGACVCRGQAQFCIFYTFILWFWLSLLTDSLTIFQISNSTNQAQQLACCRRSWDRAVGTMRIMGSNCWTQGPMLPINKTLVQMLIHTIQYTLFSPSKALLSLSLPPSQLSTILYFTHSFTFTGNNSSFEKSRADAGNSWGAFTATRR